MYDVSRIVASASIINQGYDRAVTYGYDYGRTEMYSAPVLAAVTFPATNSWPGPHGGNPLIRGAYPLATLPQHAGIAPEINPVAYAYPTIYGARTARY